MFARWFEKFISAVVLWLGFLWLGAFVILADTHYVSLSGTNNPPYTNWADAATNIQWAVDAAASSDTILVTNGTYAVTNKVGIGKNLTIQSVNGATNTVLIGNGPDITNVCFCFTGAVQLLDGFTITNFYGSLDTIEGGGAIYSKGSSLIIQNCIISGNQTTNRGGGVFVDYSGSGIVTVKNCTISGNYSGKTGGGLYINPGNGLVSNCVIRGNSTSLEAGGIYVGNNTYMVDCSISDNSAAGQGGGLRMGESGSLVQECIISNNTCGSQGRE